MKTLLCLISGVLLAAVVVATPVTHNDKLTGAITIRVPENLSGTTGQEFNAIFEASGGQPPYTWQITGGTLPAGLTLKPILVFPDCTPVQPPAKPNCRAPYDDPTKTKVTGTPTQAGSFPLSLTATDRDRQSGHASFTLIIKPAGNH